MNTQNKMKNIDLNGNIVDKNLAQIDLKIEHEDESPSNKNNSEDEEEEEQHGYLDEDENEIQEVSYKPDGDENQNLELSNKSKSAKSVEPDGEYESCEIENIFDRSNAKVQKCKDKQAEMLETQEQNALEELIVEYGIYNVCFDCVAGYKSKKSYAQHMKQEHAEEAYQQGLGKFLCRFCNTLLYSKKTLFTHMQKQQRRKMNGKLTVRQQKIVSSFTSLSNKKAQVLKKMIKKKENDQIINFDIFIKRNNSQLAHKKYQD